MLTASRMSVCQPEKTGKVTGELIEKLPFAGDIRSIEEALGNLDRFRNIKNQNRRMDEALAIERLVRSKFYHGYSHYTFCENWMANLSGRFVWNHLSAKIDPEEILDHPFAGCSQQGLVIQELLKRRGFEYATVGVPPDRFGHFASAVKVEGDWYYIDSWGPMARGQERLIPLSQVLHGQLLEHDFVGEVGQKFRTALEQRTAYVRSVNSFPAPRGLLFHKVTLWCSYWLWLILLGAAVLAQIAIQISHRRVTMRLPSA